MNPPKMKRWCAMRRRATRSLRRVYSMVSCYWAVAASMPHYGIFNERIVVKNLVPRYLTRAPFHRTGAVTVAMLHVQVKKSTDLFVSTCYASSHLHGAAKLGHVHEDQSLTFAGQSRRIAMILQGIRMWCKHARRMVQAQHTDTEAQEAGCGLGP